jgi:hypothetical protein|nr:MAG TPA: hypothetical protein [Bacteriophage sp.]
MKYLIYTGMNDYLYVNSLKLQSKIVNYILGKFEYEYDIEGLIYDENEDTYKVRFEYQHKLQEFLTFIRNTHEHLFKDSLKDLDIDTDKLGYTLNSYLNLQQQLYDCYIDIQDITFVLSLGQDCEIEFYGY